MKIFVTAIGAAIALAAPLAAYAQCNTAGMRSPGTSQPTQFTVHNRIHDRSANLYWVDFNGQKKLYATIPPNGTHTQQTYRGHIWVSENSLGYCDVMFAAHNNVEIVIK